MKRYQRSMYVALTALLLSASSAGAASFDWAVIGNTDNVADDTGYGAVDYEYSIATTEVTNAQYVEFLNAVASTDTYGLYNSNMGGSTYYSGISRTGTSGSYVYSANANWTNRPVVYVSWYDTHRFANWLHNGQLTGAQDASTTEDGAYTFSGATSVSARNTGADYWLPSEDEWYKAAYYSPGGAYYDYATGTDMQPDNNPPENDMGNSANYNNSGYAVGSPYYSTEVGEYDNSGSPYGTYDQNGNVYEWNEALIGCIRGGSWKKSVLHLPASFRYTSYDPSSEDYVIGFRVASSGGTVPEPLSIGLVLLSLSGLVLRRARRA